MHIKNDFLLLLLAILLVSSLSTQGFGQPVTTPPTTTEELVTYTKQSSFVREFEVPVQERGLKGITTDSQGNVWFYHSTNETSTIFRLEPESGEFTRYPVEGETVADNPVINLAASQLVFDKERNEVWFTDARVNSIGKLDEATGQVKLWHVPTENAGPMGIALSPDGKGLWFAEIIGNKIAYFDIQSEKLVEYPTGEDSGPALLTFDEKGQLWVSLSFSDSIMLVQPWALVPNSKSSLGMTMMSLPKLDRFSPFGIAVTDDKVYVSDHGSSRLIVADLDSNLHSYDVYWTSSSTSPTLFPTTLPGQIVADRYGNIFFPQHGGNRISEIRQEDGLMTEYDIPTGPLSTVLFLTSSEDGRRVWFTEWASNKVGYLDTSIQVPFEVQIPQQQQSSITLTKSGTARLNVSINANANSNSNSLSLSEVEVGLTRMTESGIMGITYQANPPRVNLQENVSADSTIQLQTQDNAKPGSYIVMVRVQAPEQEGSLVISRLYPIKLVLDVPQSSPTTQTGESGNASSQLSTQFDVRDLVRALAIAAIVSLVGFIVYRRVNRKPIQSKD